MHALLKEFDLTGRTALVTGGASGIGLAYVEALAEAGASVTIADLDQASGDRAAADLRALGRDVVSVTADVSNCQSLEDAFATHMSHWDRLDICFANAGLAAGGGFLLPDGSRDPASQIDTNDRRHWHRTVEVILNGTYDTIRIASGYMKAAKRGGSIVATTSNASTIVVPIVGTAYMAAKAGVAHFVRTAAIELAEDGIRVNAIAPGSFVTNIGGGVLHDPEIQKIWGSKVPLGRMGQTSEIKGLALFLASDASRFMTGSELIIDGGVSLAGH